MQDDQELSDKDLQDLASNPGLTDDDLKLLSPTERVRFDAISAQGRAGRLPLAPLGGKPPAQLDNDVLRMLASGGLKGLSAGVSLLPAGIPAKVALQMILGGAEGAVSGEDPMKKALYNGAIEPVSAGVGWAAPRLGLAGGQLVGGKFKNVMEDSEAFMRERAAKQLPGSMKAAVKDPFKGIPLGASGRTAGRLKEAGDTLAAAENASPATYNLRDLGPQRNSYLRDIANQQITTSDPIRNKRFANREGEKFVQNQIRARGRNPNLNAREAGQLRRTQAAEGKKVIEAKQDSVARAQVTAKQDISAQNSAARGRTLKELQEWLDPPLTPLNQRLSDLHTIQGVNESLRGGGAALSTPGYMGARGGLGAGIGGGLARMGVGAGVGGYNGGAQGAAVGGLAGLFASPSNISRLGYGIGHMGDLAPLTFRLGDLASDIRSDVGAASDPDPAGHWTEKKDEKGRRIPNVRRRRAQEKRKK